MGLKDKLKRNLFAIITISLSMGFMLYFIMQPKTLETLGNILSDLRPEWVFITLLAVAAGWLLESMTLHVFCHHVKRDWTLGRSFCVAMTGLFYSAITPFATGGQPMQIYSMKKMGMDTGKAGSAIALKTLSYQVVMVLYALIMVVFRLRFFQTSVSQFSFLTVIGLVSNSVFILTVFFFLVSEKTTDRVLRFFLRTLYRLHLCKRPVVRYRMIHSQFSLFHNSIKVMGRSLKIYVRAISLTVLQITIGSLIPYFLLRSFNIVNPLADPFTMVAAQVFVTMVSAFIPLPGASGAAEGSFGLFFNMFFKATIIPAVFIWRFLTYYINILAGGIVSTAGSKRFLSKEEVSV